MHRVSVNKLTTWINSKINIESPSARLQNWDYGSPGLYFITICTKDWNHYFGEIENDEMVLNELGLIVNSEWEKTPEIRPDMNLELGEVITMPNHFYAIIMIGENRFNDAIRRDAMHGVSDAPHGVRIQRMASRIQRMASRMHHNYMK